MTQNQNTNKLQNLIISTVPWSLQTGSINSGVITYPQVNIYVDMNLLENGNFELWYVEIFWTKYKVVKSSTEKYFSDNYVRYGDIFNLSGDTKIGTINFIVSNGYVVEWTIRIGESTLQISQLKDTNAYYGLKQIK